MTDTRIYIMTHKKFQVPQTVGYYPLQVGKAGKESLGFETDDTGESISVKNANYCELTGLYWIWKNVNCDIAGLCHYRRYFIQTTPNVEGKLEQRILSKEYIEQVLEEYDMIVPNSSMTQMSSAKEQYQIKHHLNDLMVCRDIILEKYPEDVVAFDWYLETNFVSLGNMVITRKEILNEYCKWLFSILFELEKRVDITGYDNYQKRIMGFLSERLFRVWIMNRSYKVREEQVEFLEF